MDAALIDNGGFSVPLNNIYFTNTDFAFHFWFVPLEITANRIQYLFRLIDADGLTVNYGMFLDNSNIYFESQGTSILMGTAAYADPRYVTLAFSGSSIHYSIDGIAFSLFYYPTADII